MKKKLNLKTDKIKQVLDGEYGSNGQFALSLSSFSTKLRASFINATDSINLLVAFENILQELKNSFGFSIKALLMTIFGIPILCILWILQVITSMKNLILNETKIKNPKLWKNDLAVIHAYNGLRIYRKLSKKDI